MRSRKTTYLIFAIFFIYLFLIYDVSFRGPDEPIYLAYTASIVEDGDLNVVNNVDPNNCYYFPSGKINISKTYNLPDYHNYGGILLWVPFYVYAKATYFLTTKFNLSGYIKYESDKVAHCALSFSTILFGFLVFLFTYFLCRAFFSSLIAFWSTIALFFGTPFFYYTLFETGNVNMVATFFSILSILFCSHMANMKKSHWFWYGLFFSICVTVKTELWFQAIFIFLFFMVLLKMTKVEWIKGVYFIVGFVPGSILRAINDYIKYGTLHIGELNLFSLRNFYFFEQLFSSYRGFFYTSPIFYICLFGFGLLVASLLENNKTKNEKFKEVFIIILSLYLFIKIFVLSFRYAWGGGTAGARILLTEFPVFVLLYAQAIQDRRNFFKYLMVIISILFVFWNFLIISEYMTGIDMKYIRGAPSLWIRFSALKDIFSRLLCVRDLDLKLKLCSPLLLVTFVITFYILKLKVVSSRCNPLRPNIIQNRHMNSKSFILFTACLYIFYLVVTGINVFNNQKNVEKLKQNGFFENAKIIERKEFENLENSSSFNEMIAYYTLKGNTEKVNKIKKLKTELYRE